jgi:kumamolisin
MAQTASATNVALPYPSAATPAAIDLGALSNQLGTTPISVTIALRLPDLNAAETLVQSLHTPGDPQFHQFLSADEFVARFAPSAAVVAKVVSGLAKYGLTAVPTSATTLNVTGQTADMERAFAVSLHSYQVPAHQNIAAYTYRAPLGRATIPAEISASVAAVAGLDSRPNFRPYHRVALRPPNAPRTLTPSGMPGNSPGLWTVTDFAVITMCNRRTAVAFRGKARPLAS